MRESPQKRRCFKVASGGALKLRQIDTMDLGSKLIDVSNVSADAGKVGQQDRQVVVIGKHRLKLFVVRFLRLAELCF